MEPSEEKPDLIEIPPEQLDPETLKAVIEAFILQEGTNYGTQEFTLDRQIAQVLEQISRHKVKLVFDPESESCHLLTERQFRDRHLKGA